ARAQPPPFLPPRASCTIRSPNSPRGAAMADPNLPLAPDLPPIETHRSGQYEFNDEQNRQFSGLVDAMRVCAGLMQLMGLAFVVLCVMAVLGERQSGGDGPPVGLGGGAGC